MKRIIYLTTAFLLLHFWVHGQKIAGTVKGTLQDSVTATVLNDATLSVIKAKDSSLVSFTLSNSNGYFEIKNLDTAAYVLLVSYQGFQTLKKPFVISVAAPEANLGKVYMVQQYKMLGEVVVRDVAPVKVKGDTLAFNAGAFKTRPNASAEDLLKKLPGMEVDKEGNVKAQGEQVQKVYVDGKEFFGNDPKLATKNLSADMIEEVEVYDDMSEQAKFNKIDDGSRSKAINLKLKKDKKRGVFGQVGAGYGTDERYTLNVRTNFFKGATQVGFFVNANNTNRLGFTTTEMLGLSGMSGASLGGGAMMMRGGGGSVSAPTTSSNGITSSWAAGVNYNDTWSKYVDINGNYNFNHTGTDNLRKSYKQTLLPGTRLIDDQNSFSRNTSDVNRAGFRLTYTLNERNSIVYSPNISLQSSEFFRDDSTLSYIERDKAVYKANSTRATVTNKGDGVNWNNNLTWRKKFAKGGRTFAATFANTYSRNNSDGYNNSFLTDYNQSGAKVKDSAINQFNTRTSNTDNYSLTLSYTEPIGRDKIWETNYSYNNNQNGSNRATFDLDGLTGKYDHVNDSLSNLFENANRSNRLGTNLRIVKKKYNYQVGVAVQRTELESDNLSRKTFLKQTYTNLFPNASFNYQFARSKSLRFNYRGRTNQPSVTQLQPIQDVSNPRNIREGNPALNQEFINNFSVNYNFFNVAKFRNLFASINYNNTYNKIVNSTVLLDSFGKQLTRPVNMDGVYSVNGNFNVGFPIQQMKGGNFNTTTRINFNRDASLVNGAKNFIKNLTLGEDLRLNYNYKEKLDLGAVASINYTMAAYTIQPTRNDDYYTHVYSLDASYTFSKGFVVASDVDYTANTGRSDGFNQSFIMWNASAAQQVMKNRGEIKLSVFDILNQNTSLTRNVNDNYIEDVQTNVLNRFFMLSFVYKINRMAGKNIQPQKGQRQDRIIIK